MKFEVKNNVAVVEPDQILSDEQSAQNLIQAVRFHTGCSAVVLHREAFDPELFRLSSGVAGKVLKQFTEQKMRLAIVGDFYDCYQTSMGAFIFGCNRSKQIGFWENEAEGIAWLNKIG